MKNSDRIVVWGAGYIGLTTAISYAEKGVKTIIYDIDEEKIKRIKNGESVIPNLEYWCGYDFNFWFQNGTIEIGLFTGELYSNINFIAIPTEKNMKPYFEALKDVLNKILYYSNSEVEEKIVIIIESTLTPGLTDKCILPLLKKCEVPIEKYSLVLAPRRDWFVSADKNLKTIPRVFGCVNKEDDKYIYELLGKVCENLVCANDYHSAEAVKSVENVIRYVNITIANQLAVAYPDIDINEILKLAGTKWNIDTYNPGFGIGGYCVPLSAEYLLEGTSLCDKLSIIKTAKEYNEKYIEDLLNILKLRRYKKIGILGLSYKGDIKVHTGSPTLEIVRKLKKESDVCVNDPYYSDEEIYEIAKCKSFRFPEDLILFDCLLLVTKHRLYCSLGKGALLNQMKKDATVIDGAKVWPEYFRSDKEINYIQIGMNNWYERNE